MYKVELKYPSESDPNSSGCSMCLCTGHDIVIVIVEILP